MLRHLKFVLTLLLALALIACGGDGGDGADDNGNGNAPDTTQAPADNGSDDDGSGDDGSDDGNDDGSDDEGGDDDGGAPVIPAAGDGEVVWELSGNYDDSGTWVWLPMSSSFVDGVWWLTFIPEGADPAAAAAGITIQVQDPTSVGFISEDILISGTSDQCDIDIDESSADGSSGSFDCNDLIGFRTDGASTDGVSFRGSWNISN